MKPNLSSKLGRPGPKFLLACADGALCAFVMGLGIICSSLSNQEKVEKLLSVLIVTVLAIVIASRVKEAEE